MAKRKRDDDAAAGTEDVTRRVSQTIVAGIAKLKQSLETARRFERQKLGRREQERKGVGDSRSIQVEIASLKSLDLGQIARSHIHKNLAKTPSIAKTGLLPDDVKLPAPSALDKVALDILARLFKQRRVGEVVGDTTRTVRQQIGLLRPDQPATKKFATSREFEKRQGSQAQNGEKEVGVGQPRGSLKGPVGTQLLSTLQDERAKIALNPDRERHGHLDDVLTHLPRDVSISDLEESNEGEEEWSAVDEASDTESSEDAEIQSDFDSDRLAAFDERIGSDSDEEGESDVEDKLARIARLVKSQKIKSAESGGLSGPDYSQKKESVKSSKKDHAARQMSPKQPHKKPSVTAFVERPTSKRQKSPEPADDSASSSDHSDHDVQVPRKVAKAGFLPSLSLGGYMSGTESDATDVEEHVAPRKNRRGQRARQAIWEMKFKDRAKHLRNPKKKQRDERDQGWDLQKGAVGGDVHQADRQGQRRIKRRFGGAMPAENELTASGGNAEPVGRRRDFSGHDGSSKPKKRDDEGSLHPSWLAKKQMKQQTSGALSGFKGKKITFD